MTNLFRKLNKITREHVLDTKGHLYEIIIEPIRVLGITIRKAEKIKVFISCECGSDIRPGFNNKNNLLNNTLLIRMDVKDIQDRNKVDYKVIGENNNG